MRGKRSKQYRKLMHQYALHFGHREPYQVLLDSAIIRDASRFKMRLGHMLSQTLHGEIKPLISQCCIRHLYNWKAETEADKRQKDEWIEVAKTTERRRCGHHELPEPLEEGECILSMVDPKDSGTNKHRYVVATQASSVRARLRKVAGVPLVYINRSVMILEPMADRTEEVRDADEKGKIKAGLRGQRPASGGVKRKRDDEEELGEDAPERAKAMKDRETNAATGEGQSQSQPKKKKAKGPKGPNPLSMKKSKKEVEQSKQKKTASKELVDERSAIRNAAKQDPQAAEKAMSAEVAVGEGGGEGGGDAQRKRKRKRKGKEGTAGDQQGDEADVDGNGE